MTTPRPRTPADAARLLELMATIVDDFRRDAAAVHQAIVDSMPGYPTSTLGGGLAHGGDHSDPTARYALHGDSTQADLDEWYQDLHYAFQWLAGADAVRGRHLAAMRMVRRCCNPAGCPAYRLAAPGRAGMCDPCSRTFNRERKVA